MRSGSVRCLALPARWFSGSRLLGGETDSRSAGRDDRAAASSLAAASAATAGRGALAGSRRCDRATAGPSRNRFGPATSVARSGGAAGGDGGQWDGAVLAPTDAAEPGARWLGGVRAAGVEGKVVGESVPPFEVGAGGVGIDPVGVDLALPALPRVLAVVAEDVPERVAHLAPRLQQVDVVPVGEDAAGAVQRGVEALRDADL